MSSDKVISNFIEQQFPNIYREEGPFFVEFMKQYYVWLETDESSPVYQSRRYVSNHDIDTTVDNFIVHFKEKYLKNIQFNTATNTKQLIKNSIDLYRSKGTENAIHMFFDLIFSSESEVYYPGKDIFKLSDAEYVIPRYLEVSSKPINRLLVGRTVVGLQSGASGFVESLVRRKVNNTYIEVLYISATRDEFITGEVIGLNTNNGEFTTSEFPTIIGSLTHLDVVDGGTDFSKGDVVNISSENGTLGKAIVEELESVTGLVDFELINGGWGYTFDSDVRISENVLHLKNVKLESESNTSLYGRINNVVQPLANVQWYDNTAPFSVGDTVYNYYANGDLIGTSKIVSAEYGTNTTTNFFMLNTISGQTDIDDLYYYKAGNTASFKVHPAGHSNITATGSVVGISSNVFVYVTGSANNYSPGDVVYQSGTANSLIVSAKVDSVDTYGGGVIVLKVDSLDGMFLTNRPLNKAGSNVSGNIQSLSFEMGVNDINNSFFYGVSNYIYDLNSDSNFSGSVDFISFGSGADFDIDPDLVETEVVDLNVNFLIDHVDDNLARNQLNAESYGALLNNAHLNTVLEDALNFETKTLGMIARLMNENPGGNYTYAPFVSVYEPLVAPLRRMDFIIKLENNTGVFVQGERITQSINGAKGFVKFANTSEVHVRRLTYETRWEAGNTSSHQIIGASSGYRAYPTDISIDNDGIMGWNAQISTDVVSSTTSVRELKVIDSGFGFKDGEEVTFLSSDNLRAGTALANVVTSGTGTGYFKDTSGFLSNNKYLYDGDFYQDFSYEIRSPITASRYTDMLKNVLHVAGTKVFSAIMKSKGVNSKSKVVSSVKTITSD